MQPEEIIVSNVPQELEISRWEVGQFTGDENDFDLDKLMPLIEGKNPTLATQLKNEWQYTMGIEQNASGKIVLVIRTQKGN